MSDIVVQNEKKALNIFGSPEDFEFGQRVAKALSTSGCLPKNYENNVGSCLILLDMSHRLNASPVMVAQNMHIIHGRPSWSASYLIAGFNSSKAYTPIRYMMGNDGKCKTMPTKENLTCAAVTKCRETGEEILGTKISIEMAVAEGWYGKSGSKWQTMPEQMLKYRAASFLIRAIAPEMSMGFQTAEEVEDMIDVTPTPYRAESVDTSADSMVNPVFKKAPLKQEVEQVIEDIKAVNEPRPEMVEVKTPMPKQTPKQETLDDYIPDFHYSKADENGEIFDPLINEADKIKTLFSIKSSLKEVIDLLNSPKVAEIKQKYPDIYLEIEQEAQIRKQQIAEYL